MATLGLLAAAVAWGQATPTHPLPAPEAANGAAATTPTQLQPDPEQVTDSPAQPSRPAEARGPGRTAREASPAFERVSGETMGVRSIRGAGSGAGVSIVTPGNGGYEPYLNREIEYRDNEIPQGGRLMTLNSMDGNW